MQIAESHFYYESVAGAFDSALSPGASIYADLTVGGGNAGPAKAFITTLQVIAKEDLDYRVEFHRKTLSKVVNTASYMPPNILGWVNLLGSTDALPSNWPGNLFGVATTYGTMFAWYVSGLSIPYEDFDPGTGQLHVNVVNQSGSAKSSGTAGYLWLRVGTVQAS